MARWLETKFKTKVGLPLSRLNRILNSVHSLQDQMRSSDFALASIVMIDDFARKRADPHKRSKNRLLSKSGRINMYILVQLFDKVGRSLQIWVKIKHQLSFIVHAYERVRLTGSAVSQLAGKKASILVALAEDDVLSLCFQQNGWSTLIRQNDLMDFRLASTMFLARCWDLAIF